MHMIKCLCWYAFNIKAIDIFIVGLLYTKDNDTDYFLPNNPRPIELPLSLASDETSIRRWISPVPWGSNGNHPSNTFWFCNNSAILTKQSPMSTSFNVFLSLILISRMELPPLRAAENDSFLENDKVQLMVIGYFCLIVHTILVAMSSSHDGSYRQLCCPCEHVRKDRLYHPDPWLSDFWLPTMTHSMYQSIHLFI